MEPELNDLTIRREHLQQEITRMTTDLSAEELQIIVEWLDRWKYGRGQSQ